MKRKAYDIPHGSWLVRRLPSSCRVIVGGSHGLLTVDLLNGVTTALDLPPGFAERQHIVASVMTSEDGSDIMITDDDHRLCWCRRHGVWSRAAELPNPSSRTDACYVWSDTLILRKTFGTVYWQWNHDAGAFDPIPAIRVRRRHPEWLAAAETWPGGWGQVHRSWQDSRDMVFDHFRREPHQVAHASWGTPRTSWSRPVATPSLRLAALGSAIYRLTDASDGRCQIERVGEDGVDDAILTAPPGYDLSDIETVAHGDAMGVVAIAEPLGTGSTRLIFWPEGS